MPGKVLVGTASWSDPGFVTDWYPKGLPAGHRLNWYADRFNLVELNSSFYAIPNHRLVERWCEQTPPGFTFDVKLHRLLSRHSTKPQFLSPDLRNAAVIKNDKVILTPQLEKAVAKRFLREIEPFSEREKMGALLLQLSPSFHPEAHQLSELDDLFGYLEGYRVAVELRHRDWVTGGQRAETEKYFQERHITFVSVDAPHRVHFMIMPDLDLVTNPGLAYLRLHGRNATGFVSGRSVAERFDYKYSPEELSEIAHRVVNLADAAAEVHVVYNNNTSNYAPRDASEFKDILADAHPEIDTGAHPPAEAAPARTMEMDLGDIPKRSNRAKLQTAKR